MDEYDQMAWTLCGTNEHKHAAGVFKRTCIEILDKPRFYQKLIDKRNKQHTLARQRLRAGADA
jgi:hypothetical protein